MEYSIFPYYNAVMEKMWIKLIVRVKKVTDLKIKRRGEEVCGYLWMYRDKALHHFNTQSSEKLAWRKINGACSKVDFHD